MINTKFRVVITSRWEGEEELEAGTQGKLQEFVMSALLS